MRVLYYALAFPFLLIAITASAQCDTLDLAQGRLTSVSSIQNGDNAAFGPALATDGDSTHTRWSSDFPSATDYLYVDLGATKNLCQVRLYWENAYATEYAIDGTNDTTTTWTQIFYTNTNSTLINNISLSGTYRFVRLRCLTKALPAFGYSLYEIQVFGPAPSCNPGDIAQGATTISTTDESGAFPASAATDFDQNTRWASAFSDEQSLTVNLGSVQPICRTTFYWFGNTYPTNFSVDLSNDDITYTPAVTITGNTSNYNIVDINQSAQYVRMHATARNNTGVGYSLQEFIITSATTLPVKLTDFTAVANNNQRVQLAWTTAQEFNNSYFNIERSTDGTHYSTIGKVPGAGNSSNPIHYSWTDTFPSTGKNYYRLKQVDIDGRSEYSPIATATITGAGGQLSIYPNPARETVNLVNPSGLLIRDIRIFNLSGREVKHFTNTTQLSIGDLPPGVYTLKILTSQGDQILKLLK
ncbi:MAG: discoidin domain-containing protein [Bacteroidetes bacterium]|nr:discoidin domain-containing protein [Bacteroidota bacterium]